MMDGHIQVKYANKKHLLRQEQAEVDRNQLLTGVVGFDYHSPLWFLPGVKIP